MTTNWSPSVNLTAPPEPISFHFGSSDNILILQTGMDIGPPPLKILSMGGQTSAV